MDTLKSRFIAWRAALPPELHPRRMPTPDDHDDRVAEQCLAILQDLPTACAAYLHALPGEALERTPRQVVCDETRSAHRVRELLRDWSGQKGNNPIRLPSAIEPDAATTRGIVALVVEQLDHWDPTGELWHWTLRFRDNGGLGELPWSNEVRPFGFDRGDAVVVLRQVVAPLAEAIGLWDHRNLARNIIAFRQSPRAFHRVVDEVRRLQAEGGLAALCETIRTALGLGPGARVHWTWRHTASILERTRADDAPPIDFLYGEGGFVTVSLDASGPPSAWSTLGLLHEAFDHRDRHIRDFSRRPDRRYSAVHTQVEVDGRWIRVRIGRFDGDPGGRRRSLDAMVENLRSIQPVTIRVITPTGQEIILPQGATVLNFAVAIHPELAARCLRAIVNGVVVGPLHPLRSGDQVNIEKGDEPTPLPFGWEEAVPEGTVDMIRRRVRGYFADRLVDAGREQIRAHARRYSLDGIEDDLIDFALKRALVKLVWLSGDEDPAATRTWLRRLATSRSLEIGEQPLYNDGLEPRQRERLLEDTVRVIRHDMAFIPRRTLPPEAQDLQREWCLTCAPDAGGHIVAEVRAERVVLHRAGAETCVQGQAVIVHTVYQPRMRRWVLIEATNRTGIAADVMKVFQEKRVPVAEIVGRHTAFDRGLFRIEVGVLGQEAEEALLSRLGVVAGVLTRPRILGEQEVAQLHVPELPPPMLPRMITQQVHVIGRPVFSDEDFYGRESELGLLFRELKDAPARGCNGIWISGPYRVGKSSLIRRFGVLLERTDPSALLIYLEARRPSAGSAGEDWDRFSHRLVAEIRRATSDWLGRLGRSIPDSVPAEEVGPLAGGEVASVVALLAACRAHGLKPRPVIVVDEGVSLVAATEARGASTWEAFRRDVDLILSVPGLRFTWVGPPTPSFSWSTGACLPGTTDFFSHCSPIHVRGFDQVREVSDLVQARQRDPRPPRHLSQGNAEYLMELTGGEPSWLNALAQQLEKVAKGRPHALIYDRPAIDRAVLDVLRDPILFRSRTVTDDADEAWVPGVAGDRLWRVLRALAVASDAGGAVRLVKLKEQLPGESVPELRTLMGALVQMGLVVESAHSSNAWAFVGALLHKFVCRQLADEEDA